jgi:hypothetical protein
VDQISLFPKLTQSQYERWSERRMNKAREPIRKPLQFFLAKIISTKLKAGSTILLFRRNGYERTQLVLITN